MFNNLRKQLSRFISPVSNTMNLATDFLRYGPNKRMYPNWSEVAMSDKDLYSGYSYAAIRNRANKVAAIANEYIKTETEAKSASADFIHPYLQTLTDSPTFSDYWFWYFISTYLDLEGIFYLMAVRTTEGNRVGNAKEFKLLNPYNIRRVLDTEKLTVTGYVETRYGMVREIPPNMIIEIRELNPFDENTPFAMTDASKESAFTLKTSGDYTRHALKNNINAPGVLSTDVILEPQEFTNFKSRVTNHTKGEPLFGNGSGAITWQSMQMELSKASLDNVENINRDALFSVAGVSKTMMGIEQSGTTRDTARVQKDLFIEGHIIPRITLIIDALNQDYKNNFPDEYAKTKADIVLDNPLSADHEATQKDATAKDLQLDLYQKLIDMGYDNKTAAKYTNGDIGVEDLGKPKNKPKPIDPSIPVVPVLTPKTALPDGTPVPPVTPPTPPVVPTPPAPVAPSKNAKKDTSQSQHLIKQQEGALKNAVVNIDEQMVMAGINRIRKSVNQFENESDVITKSEKKKSYNELVAILAAFYTVVLSLKGPEVLRDRIGQFALSANFSMDKDIKSYIKEISSKVAESHVETIASDILQTARDAALEGMSQDQIIAELKNKYSSQMVEGRAKVVARTETNRAFTRAQLEADQQFVEQNDLGGRAFKQWVTRSGNPCEYCQELADEPPIPLDDSFRSLGEDITVGSGADAKSLSVSFESLDAGNAHPNCSCEYELIIESAQNKLDKEKKQLNDLIDEIEKI